MTKNVTLLKQASASQMFYERDKFTAKQMSMKLLRVCCSQRQRLGEDDGNKRDDEPFAMCHHQVGWLKCPISKLNEALTLPK